METKPRRNVQQLLGFAQISHWTTSRLNPIAPAIRSRFVASGTRRNPTASYRAQDYMNRQLVGASFPEILQRVGDALYDPATAEGRFVFYNVSPLARTGKLDVVAFGRTPEELPRRLGLR